MAIPISLLCACAQPSSDGMVTTISAVMRLNFLGANATLWIGVHDGKRGMSWFTLHHAPEPLISVIVVFYNMTREAPRTLYSLSRGYQRDCDGLAYEVVALDHGSSPALPADLVTACGPHFSYRYIDTDSCSPVDAINEAANAARGRLVMINIDGARILSPGLLAGTARAAGLFDSPFVHTLGFHLGPGLQNETMLEGYNQEAEDRLLARSDWRDDGYRLFDISALAGSSSGGFLANLSESNCFALPRQTFLDMGGFHPGFQDTGGGLANLDIYRRAFERPELVPVRLFGEGTFHQFHGGVATNVPASEHPWERYARGYQEIYKQPFRRPPDQRPVFLGRLHPCARRFVL